MFRWIPATALLAFVCLFPGVGVAEEWDPDAPFPPPRVQRFLDMLTDDERAHYEQRLFELKRMRDVAEDLSYDERLELRRKFRHLTEELKGRRRAVQQEMRSLPRAERRELMHKLKNFRELPDAEKKRLRERYQMFQARTPDERERLRDNARRWKDMSPERQAEMREQMRRFRELPDDERHRLLEEARKRRQRERD